MTLHQIIEDEDGWRALIKEEAVSGVPYKVRTFYDTTEDKFVEHTVFYLGQDKVLDMKMDKIEGKNSEYKVIREYRDGT